MTLNKKIAEILKQHPEGEDFFNALDAMIRGDLDIIKAFMNFVENSLVDTKKYTVVLTGQFGNSIINTYGKELFDKFADVILINGGIRSGKDPIIFKTYVNSSNCIILDDSFYSGKTCDTIKNVLKNTLKCSVILIYVIYDGSINRRNDVLSMFRYHKTPDA